MVVHKQQPRAVPEPSILGPGLVGPQLAAATAVLPAASGVGARGVVAAHQALEGAVLPVEPYYEAAGQSEMFFVG